MSKHVLVATEKPFAKVAVAGIAEIFRDAGYELTLLESYKDKADYLKAVAAADAPDRPQRHRRRRGAAGGAEPEDRRPRRRRLRQHRPQGREPPAASSP